MKHIKNVEYIDDRICRVILDDYTSLELDSFSVSQSGIAADEDVEDEVIEELIFGYECIKAQKEALKYLNSRMRTEKQIIKKLREKGFSEETALRTAENMKQWGYIDDAAYARAYIEYRLAGSKKSWRTIFYDLKLDGIDSEIIDSVKEDYDTDEYARANAVASEVLRGRNDEASLKRLNGILARNGFGWDVINQTIRSIASDEENY